MQTKRNHHPDSVARLADETARHHARIFGCAPDLLTYAPGRIEVLGNHTDYNEGLVLSCAIDAGICSALSAVENPELLLSAPSERKQWRIPLRGDFAPEAPDASAYVGGMTKLLLEDQASRGAGLQMTILGDVPIGAGLSSSAALEMSVGLALARHFGLDPEPLALARFGQQAENQYAGVQCGLLDQMTSLMAQRDALLRIDFRTLRARAVPMPDAAVFLICHTGAEHRLAESAYNDRRQQCEAAVRALSRWSGRPLRSLRDADPKMLAEWAADAEPEMARRAAHVVGEIDRVERGCEALDQGDLDGFGRLMFDSHESSRLRFENSCPELDTVVQAASRAEGVYGARLSGGGFGGSAILLVRADAVRRAAREVVRAFQAEFGREPTVRVAHPSAGAQVLTG